MRQSILNGCREYEDRAMKIRVTLFSLLLLPLLSSGCLTAAVKKWAEDEVHLIGGRSDEMLAFEIKNIHNFTDGTYGLFIPDRWEVVETEILDSEEIAVVPQYDLTLTDDWGYYQGMAAERLEDDDVTASLSSRSSADPGNLLSVRIEAGSGRHYRLTIYAADLRRSRWVRLGELDVGSGTQWPHRRATSFILYPIAVSVDIVTWPFVQYFVMMLYGSPG
jgi:hypothetical protein